MMNREKIVNWSSFLTGAAIGGAFGAVAGVLFAPQQGRQTREQVGEWLKEKRDEGSEILARVKQQGQHKAEQLSSALRASRQAYEEVSRRG